jgi:aerotolerance regulator-like protein
MLGLLSPGWLIGLTSLSLPLALHLWSRRGGRPIRVGSIRLFLSAQPATRRHWALQDLALLLVRMATLASLVVALAGPYWGPRAISGGRWALVASDVAQRAVLTDSLTRAGFYVHLLDSTRTPPDRPQNYWEALREADRIAPRGTHFEVFAPDRLRYFRGERPTIRADVAWHVRPPVRETIAPPLRAMPRLVAVFADADRSDDARYVTAALRAAASATGIPAVVTPPAPATALETAATADWIVWLSSRPVPEAALDRVRRGATVLTDAVSGVSRSDHRSRILFVDQPSDAWLARRTVADSGAPLWTDGAGNPLLTMTREGLGLRYRFGSRFHPSWSELVLRGAFPEALARVWIGPDSSKRPGGGGDRPVTLSQLLPAHDSSAGPAGAPPEQRRSLFIPFWLLAATLFGVERRLAARPRRQPT